MSNLTSPFGDHYTPNGDTEPLWQRIVGPLSPRADHLRSCLPLVAHIETADANTEMASRMRNLLAQYARSVPGALSDAWNSGPELDIPRVRAAILAELDLIRTEDEKSRQREAERAARYLHREQLIWGGSMPQAVARKSE
jgi:hypothetical protein